MRDLLVIVPTRSRPDNLLRLVDAMRGTCTEDVQVLVCLDTDDAHNYEPIEGVWYLIKERQRFGAWTNEAAVLYAGAFRYLGVIGDNSVPRTKGWDRAVTATLEELGTGICYGNDLLQGENLPTVCFMTSDIVSTLGYMHPPTLVHMYCDNFWLELGRAMGRIRYLPDVVIEHLHPSKGKSANDPVYGASASLMERDRIAFETYMQDCFEADLLKVRHLLAEPARPSHDQSAGSSSSPINATNWADTSHIPILITCRNRVEALRDLVTWLEAAGQERIIFVDNASTFEPLLSYYRDTPHEVVRLEENVGHLAVWDADILETIDHRGSYVVTDCDIVPDDDAPADALAHFADLLFRYSDVDKVGFGLRIDDLPDWYQFRFEVIDWESQFWDREVEPGVYRADIDTTFALYRPSVRCATYRALRTGPPYVARHVPWYKDSGHLSEEDAYYRDHASPEVTNWDRPQLPDALRGKIDAQRRERSSGEGITTPSLPADVRAQGVPPTQAESDLFEVAALSMSGALAAERAARRQVEDQLTAIRNTRSYRWTEPARRLRSSATGDRVVSRIRKLLRP